MNEIKISDLNFNKQNVKQAAADKNVPEKNGFSNVMKDALGKVTSLHKEADKAIEELATGGDVSKAVIAMEKADMSFQVMKEARNKLLSAYEEVMRMQV